MLLAIASSVCAATMTAAWNANPELDVAGYKLSYGTASGSYTTTIDVGTVTSYVLTVTGGQTYYFVVQAYDSVGRLSANSAETSLAIAASGPISSISPASGPVGIKILGPDLMNLTTR